MTGLGEGMLDKLKIAPRLMACIDSGLVVVMTITLFLIGVVVFTLGYVKYEWCEVLFKNATVNSSQDKGLMSIVNFPRRILPV